MLTIMRSSAPDYVPTAEGSVVYDSYPPGEGIEVGRLLVTDEYIVRS